jgi:CRISPR/Cas system CMR-associated protein Cmr1 (group 7 of RAMP superfamily)
MPYGCNDNIKGVGNLSSPGCNEINVMSLFNTIPRTKRSHGHKRIQHPNVKKSSKPRTLQDTFNEIQNVYNYMYSIYNGTEKTNIYNNNTKCI